MARVAGVDLPTNALNRLTYIYVLQISATSVLKSVSHIATRIKDLSEDARRIRAVLEAQG